MNDSSGVPNTDDLSRRTKGNFRTTVDTSLRPSAKSTPDLAVIAALYLESIRIGQRPIQALMERFNVDRESAKAWPALCREAGLLPARDQPQIVAVTTDESAHKLRFVD